VEHDLRLPFAEGGCQVSAHGDAERAAETADLAQVAVGLAGVDVDAAEELDRGAADQFADACLADGAEAELNDADGVHGACLLSISAYGTKLGTKR
jgi:hypothetical protein